MSAEVAWPEIVKQDWDHEGLDEKGIDIRILVVASAAHKGAVYLELAREHDESYAWISPDLARQMAVKLLTVADNAEKVGRK